GRPAHRIAPCRQELRRRARPRGRVALDRAGRDPLPGRGERLRQVDAHQGRLGRLAARPGRAADRWAADREHDAARRHRPGRAGDLPGLLAVREPLGCREPGAEQRAAGGAEARLLAPRPPDRPPGHRPPRRRARPRRAGRDPADLRQAARRHRPRADVGPAPAHHGRADHGADRARGRGAVPRGAGHPVEGHRRSLRQPQDARDARDQRAADGHPQRPRGRRRSHRRVRRGRHHPRHDRPGDRRRGLSLGTLPRRRAAAGGGGADHSRPARGCLPPRHARRDRRRLRPARLRPDGTRPCPLRHASRLCGPHPHRRPRGPARQRAARDRARHRLCPGGPADRGPLPRPDHRPQHAGHLPPPAEPRRRHPARPRRPRRRRDDPGDGHRHPDRRPPRHPAFGRQPAARGDRPLAAQRPAPADPERPHRRRRCRLQVRHPSQDPRAGPRAGARRADDLGRPPGAGRELQPHPRAASRPPRLRHAGGGDERDGARRAAGGAGM
ncbi:MAG: Ribose ABC transport system, ATP-binding protein RbsA, partial [uncultured Craurococcus sp.]